MLDLADKHIIMVIITTSRVDKVLAMKIQCVQKTEVEAWKMTQIKLLVMKTKVCLVKTHWIKFKY